MHFLSQLRQETPEEVSGSEGLGEKVSVRFLSAAKATILSASGGPLAKLAQKVHFYIINSNKMELFLNT